MAYSTSTIAKGCFGKVYKEKYNGTWAAIKRVPCDRVDLRDLEREYDVYKTVDHPNIVKLLGNITLEDEKWVIPLEFIFGEDLETTIFKASKSKIQLSPTNKGTIITGMCEGLLFLHSKDIVHQDLKPDNIMVEHNTNRAVIIDLGLAKFFKNGFNSAVDNGNKAYSAPEVLNEGRKRDQLSDVWAMGKIIAELCVRVRLNTPSVCPGKIKETLRDQPYCRAVCRMVDPNRFRRASMVDAVKEIKRATTANVTNNSPPTQQVSLKPPSSQINDRKRSPSPMKQERNPKPETKAVHPQAARNIPPPSKSTEDRNKNQTLVPKGSEDLTENMLKLVLYQEAAKDLPCKLPTTGRVVVRHFEEKNGEVGIFQQKEVVTRDGKIVKYDDINFESK